MECEKIIIIFQHFQQKVSHHLSCLGMIVVSKIPNAPYAKCEWNYEKIIIIFEPFQQKVSSFELFEDDCGKQSN